VIPPFVMWIKVQWFGIWIPLFLIWPLVVALLLLILPLIFLGMAVAGKISKFWMILRIILAAYTMVCSIRGLKIEIHKEIRTLELYLP